MCLIVAQPAKTGTKMSKGEIKKAWNANSDGAGYAFAAKGELVVRKAFFKVKHLIAAYNRDWAETKGEATFVVHFRMATHGGRSVENTHPFLVGREQKVAAAHNGILPVSPPKDWSDTRFWLSMVYGGRAVSEILAPEALQHVGDHVGPANKLALLAANGVLAFVNEDQGTWEEGNWYSSQHARGREPQPYFRDWGFGTCHGRALPDKTERALYQKWVFQMEEEEEAEAEAEEEECRDSYEEWEAYLAEYEGRAK